MRTFAALTIAVLLAAAASPASAFAGPSSSAPATTADAATQVGPDGIVHDECHGRTAGTAHALCGTATGGPSGGLF